MKFLDALKICLNPKVIGGLAVAAAVIFVFAPNLALAALPLLVLAVCPLSMLLMAGVMMGGSHGSHDQSTADTGVSDGHDSGEVASLRAEVAALRGKLDRSSDAVGATPERGARS